MQYITSISIDTHGLLHGHATTVKLKGSDKPLENVAKVELVITPSEGVAANLTLLEPWPPREDTPLTEQAYLHPYVELAPLVALLEEATCGEYRVDSTSWVYLTNGDMQVTFHRVGEQDTGEVIDTTTPEFAQNFQGFIGG